MAPVHGIQNSHSMEEYMSATVSRGNIIEVFQTSIDSSTVGEVCGDRAVQSQLWVWHVEPAG